MTIQNNQKLLCEDIKEKLYPHIEDPLDRIMEFFTDNKGLHLENAEATKEIYEKLDWKNEVNFDVINSFWTIYTCGLAIANESLNKDKDKMRIWYRFTKDKKSVKLNGKYFMKSIYGKTYIKRTKSEKPTDFQKIVSRLRKDYLDFKKLASLCHAVKNFTPCPGYPYNSAKGTCNDVKDFLPLMIDKIEKCILDKKVLEYGDKKQISIETLKEYKKWFKDNRKKCCLQEFYEYDKDKEKLSGIPLFKGQSLEHPLPTNKKELEECLENIIERLEKRKEEMEIR